MNQRPQFAKGLNSQQGTHHNNYPTFQSTPSGYSSIIQPSQVPQPPASGNIYTPMPPPANQTHNNQQTYSPFDTYNAPQNSYINQQQTQSSIIGPYSYYEQKYESGYKQSNNSIPYQQQTQPSSNPNQSVLETQNSYDVSQSLEFSRIISNSQLKDMEISSNTHNMIIIGAKDNQFEIKPFDENLKKDKFKNKQLINSNLFIIQNNKTTIPEFEIEGRFCQQHNNKRIDKICAEKECKELNDLLLCQDCARNHKGHTLYDIPEVLYLIQQKDKILDKNETFIGSFQCRTFANFKILKSNITQQLQEIENQLTSAFNNYKQYLQEIRSNHIKVFEQLSTGGLSKMIESVNYIFNQGLFQEGHSNSNELQYKQLLSQLDSAQLSMQKFQQFAKEGIKEFVNIKINNFDLKIENHKIENLNDLYYQIKIDALKQKFTNILDQEFLLLNNNKAIKLKDNYQKINLKNESQIQVISYEEI
ncbi:unnamed protein product [Paramecium sonneborni]|uniref:B box-type domain-containing protein n=1 Tax=Paramecium sonneborni TaxID=65129 RepID=A0A8S1JYT8_9CILI|nr:unnamed protein product [Paramecium sonneborni]